MENRDVSRDGKLQWERTRENHDRKIRMGNRDGKLCWEVMMLNRDGES